MPATRSSPVGGRRSPRCWLRPGGSTRCWPGGSAGSRCLARRALGDGAARPGGALRGGRIVRSYRAASVVARSGDVLGAVFLGHHQPRACVERDERLLGAIAAHLAVALEKAELLSERVRV